MLESADTPDFFRPRLVEMIDLRHPLAVLASRLPWPQIEANLAPLFTRRVRAGRVLQQDDLFGPSLQVAGAGVAAAGRPRLPLRLMASLLYLKHAYKLSDEELVERWAENVVWQHFSGMTFYEPRFPCDATQIGRFRSALGEAGVEELLKATIDTAVASKAIRPAEFERVIVDTTVQKAIAHPVDSRLLEIARHKVVAAARRAGIALKQTFVKEGKTLRRKAGGYAHAKQFKRLKKVLKRQRTILGVVLREVQRKIDQAAQAVQSSGVGLHTLRELMGRAECIRTQRPKDKNKLYALHAPEAECIAKGKARRPCEFGVKVSVAVTHRQGLMVGARSFTGNPYDGHTLKQDNGMDRCWLKGQTGDALHAVLCAAGYNVRWLLRAIARLGLKGLLLRLSAALAARAKAPLAAPVARNQPRRAGANVGG